VIAQLRQRGAQVLSRWFGPVVFGVIEQIVLTLVNLTFTAIMGHWLGARAFGWLSIAWVLLQFLETSSMGLFGDAVPASARRLPSSSQPAFRGTFLSLSFGYSLLILTPLVLAWPAAAWLGAPEAMLIPATGLAFVGLRAQNAARRLYYLSGLRKEAAAAAIVNALSTAVGALLLIYVFKSRNPAHAMLVVAIANSLAALVLFAQRRTLPLSQPTRQLVRWARKRLWRTGRWLLVSNAMSWIGNFGPVVLVGAIMGVAASGTLRVIMTLTVPPSQLATVLLSIIIPRTAVKSHAELRNRAWPIALQTTALIGTCSASYALAMILGGQTLTRLAFGEPANSINQLTIALATLGFTMEAVRYGCNVVLISRGTTSILTVGQTCALISALILVPIGALHGFDWVIAAGVFSNNINTLVVLVYFVLINRRLAASRRATASETA
jgi:O-antigen/teichoic acid export membrane protein